VAERAGVSRVTFYAYFANKDECFLAAFEWWADAVFERVERAMERADDRIPPGEAGARALTRFLERKPAIARFLLEEVRAGGRSCQLAQLRWLERLTRLLGDVEPSSEPERRTLDTVASLTARPPDESEAAVSPQLLTRARRKGAAQDERKAAQRELLLGAMMRVATDKGYEASRVEDVLGLSGLSRWTFYEHFADKEECFLSVFDAAAAAIEARVREAIARATDDDPSTLLQEILEPLLRNPAVAQTVTNEIKAAGGPGRERYVDAVGRIATLIAPCYRRSAVEEPGLLAWLTVAAAVSAISSEIDAGATTLGEVASGLAPLIPASCAAQ